MEYKEYEPLFDFGAADKKAWFLTADDYVTLSDGSGIVHIAPAFGEDDARVGRKYDLPFVQMVNEQGRFKAVTPWEGVFVKDADPKIIAELKERSLLLSTKAYSHSYPFCWRCRITSYNVCYTKLLRTRRPFRSMQYSTSARTTFLSRPNVSV